MMKSICLPGALASALLLGACAGTPHHAPAQQQVPSIRNPLIASNYQAAEVLIKQLNAQTTSIQSLIVTTIVNIDELSTSSTFGRLSSEQIAAHFAQTGYSIVEMKLRDFVYMQQNQGELMLTREIQEVAKKHNAQAIVAGTYALGSDRVFVNLKVIQPNTNLVLAVHDYSFPLDNDLRTMTRGPQKSTYK